MNKGTAIVGFLLCFMAGMALMWGVDRGAGARAGGADVTAEAAMDSGVAWDDSDAAVPISSKDPTWGSRTAPVTLVLFSDFECPFCSKVEATLTQLRQEYGPQKLRIVWKSSPLPFHKSAKPASVAAETVFRLKGSEAFWKFHEQAFQNQRALTPENFEAWAVQAGVDKAKYKAAFDKQEFAAKVDADLASSKAAGVSGTPASLINGILLSGAQPIDKFKAVIDEQLAAAAAAVKSGTKPEKVYAKLSTENKAKAPAAAAKQEPAEDKSVWKVPVGNSPAQGPDTALVTIVEFSDFQCPFCSRVVPTMEEVVKTYGDKVRFVWKHNPLPMHPRAEPASELTLEARAQKGDKGFWDAYNMLFKNQQKLADEDLLGYAKELGLDVDKVKDAIVNKKYNAQITADQDLSEDLQASGTPHFFINGRRLVGAQPIEKFKAVIDEEIKKSQDMLAKGVSPKELYDTIIKDGKTPPPPETKTVDLPPSEAAWKGSDKAKIMMQIFSDFECPYCKRAEDTVAQVEKAYGDKLKIVWRHKPLPFHKSAMPAALAAEEAKKQKGNEGFWKMHDALFKSAGTPDALSRPSMEKIAEELGLNLDKFKKALDTEEHKKFIESETAIADKAGISGTPAFLITVSGSTTGYFISGAQPFPKFKKTIDMVMKEAASAKK
jgi:protein-disulfide isomerase